MSSRPIILEQDLQKISKADLPWDVFANKTFLITGANGFLPAYMIETLLYLNDTCRLGVNIIGLVRNKDRAEARFKPYLHRDDFQLKVQDVAQPLKHQGKIDYIIHAASQASPKYYGADPVGTLSANILGTHHLLELAREHEVESFFYFSSGEVYGELKEEQIPIKENFYGYLDPLQVRSCYAESKRMAENMIISFAHQFGVKVKIVRPFHTYGPGLRLDDGRVYADFVADIIHNRDLELRGDGLAVRSFCYLADATLGFFTVLLKGQNGEAYNVGNPGCSLSVIDLANCLTKLFKEKNLKVIQKTRPDQAGYIGSKVPVNCPDITKIAGLGWAPSVSITEGFARTVASFLESAKE